MTPRIRLYQQALGWDNEAPPNDEDHDASEFQHLLDEILFHAKLRYRDYEQARHDGEFTDRLERWLSCMADHDHRKAMLRMLAAIHFISRPERTSLYRDAFRRIIVPWIAKVHGWTAADMLAPNWQRRVEDLLLHCLIFRVTESCDLGELLHANALDGVPRPLQLHPDVGTAYTAATANVRNPDSVLVIEDFVGTGNQVRSYLIALAGFVPPEVPMLFVPLVALEDGLRAISAEDELGRLLVQPATVVPDRLCIKRRPSADEPEGWDQFRALVAASAQAVRRRYDPRDPAPSNEFGYGGCGALVVPAYNTPNNTLPLIWHRAPNWNPIFRRIGHA